MGNCASVGWHLINDCTLREKQNLSKWVALPCLDGLVPARRYGSDVCVHYSKDSYGAFAGGAAHRSYGHLRLIIRRTWTAEHGANGAVPTRGGSCSALLSSLSFTFTVVMQSTPPPWVADLDQGTSDSFSILSLVYLILRDCHDSSFVGY